MNSFFSCYTPLNYILCVRGVHGLFIGDYIIYSGLAFCYSLMTSLGSRFFLYSCVDTIMCCQLQLNNFSNVIYCRSQGTYISDYVGVDEYGLIILKLPSGQVKLFTENLIGVVGRNLNIFSKYQCWGGGGNLAIRGLKAHVRGVAKNPVDHPHGGRTKTNQPEVSP